MPQSHLLRPDLRGSLRRPRRHPSTGQGLSWWAVTAIAFALLSAVDAGAARAGRGAFLLIENGSGEAARVHRDKLNCVYHVDDLIDFVIPPHTIFKRYIEANNDGGCAFETSDTFWSMTVTRGGASSTMRFRCFVGHGGSGCHIQDGVTLPSNVWDVQTESYNTFLRDADQDTLYVAVNPRQPARWMAGLRSEGLLGNLALHQAVWPGSHDTLAGPGLGLFVGGLPAICPGEDGKWFLGGAGIGWATAQRLGLREQLDRGIRYIDARFCEAYGTFYAAHTYLDGNDTFDTFLATLRDWAADPANAQEVVIVNLRFEGSDSGTRAAFESLGNTLAGQLVRTASITPASTFDAVWATGRHVIAMTSDGTEARGFASSPGLGDWLFTKSAWMTDGGYDVDLNTIFALANAEIARPRSARLSLAQLERSPSSSYIMANLTDSLRGVELRYAAEQLDWLRDASGTVGGVNAYIRDFTGGAIDGQLARTANGFRSWRKAAPEPWMVDGSLVASADDPSRLYVMRGGVLHSASVDLVGRCGRSPTARTVLAGIVFRRVVQGSAATSCATVGQGVQCGLLRPDEALWPGWTRSSCDGRSILIMQLDGNLVLYSNNAPRWATGTNGRGGFRAIQQLDGNFVLYTSDDVPLFATGSVGHPGAYFAIQDDGNLVVYSVAGVPLWASGTHGL